MNKTLLKSKLKATVIHLSLSFVVFLVLSYLIFFVWYPGPLFWVDGGWQGMRIIAAVDLILGPVITFLIWNSAKSRCEIGFDLFIIAVIQVGALIYGVTTTHAQRPLAIVLIDEFLVSATLDTYGDQLKSSDELRQYSPEVPPIIYAEFPMTAEAVNKIHKIKIEQKIVEHAQMHLYKRFDGFVVALKQKQLRFFQQLDIYQKRNEFDNWLSLNKRQADAILIAPFTGRYGMKWLVFNHKGRLIGYF
jgi:hypothetical protein